jgi:hypothetical protein
MKETSEEASESVEQSSHTIARETGNIMLEGFDLSQIQDDRAQELLLRLLNLVESLSADLREAQQEHQRLRDASARLKGDKGKPSIQPNAASKNRHSSSEKDRKGGNGEREAKASSAQPKGPKQERGRSDREETLQVAPALLPGDAQCKGHAEVLVQDLLCRTANVLWHKETCAAPSEPKTSVAEMPRGSQGQCGRPLTAFGWVAYGAAQVSEPKMVAGLGRAGIRMAEAEVSPRLLKQQEPRHAETAERGRAGLERAPWQQTDDTGTRVHGVNEHCHILCPPLSTACWTLRKQDRLSVIDGLSNPQERRDLFNEQALASLPEKQPISQRVIEEVAQLPSADVLEEEGLAQTLSEQVSTVSAQQQQLLTAGARLAAYQAEKACAVLTRLLGEEAGQSQGSPEEGALCWVHAGRHDQKLRPVLESHQQLHADVMSQYWDASRELRHDKKKPDNDAAARGERRFDELFGTRTGSATFEERIEKTRAKKTSGLAVLRHPEVPLHNNAAE